MYFVWKCIVRQIFHWFLVPTCTPENQLKSSRLAFSWFLGFKVDVDFLSDSGLILVQFWCWKSDKIVSWRRLGSVFGASWGVLGSSQCVFGRVGASWRCLGASGLHPGASWGAIIAPGRVCGAFKTPQKSGAHLEFAAVSPREGGTPSDRLHFGRFLGPCWHHFGSIFVSLGAFDFGGLWCHVSTHFCKFWRPELNQTHVRNRGFSFSAFSIASIWLPGLPPYMIFRSTILPCS